MLPGGTQLVISDVLFFSRSQRNLLSFKYIHRKGYHIEITNESGTVFLHITSLILGNKHIMKKLSTFSSRLYYTYINPI